MKESLLTCLLLFAWEPPALPQSTDQQPVKFLFRFYDDNDFLNINLHGTDKSYTNGLMLDVFFTKRKAALPLSARLFTKTGNETTTVYGWSLSQLMFTPSDLNQAAFQPKDYFYAGALTLTRTVTAYNEKGKFSFHTGTTVGIRGSPAMAAEVQKFVHKVIRDEIPQGWHNQLKACPLLNFRFAAEKQVFGYRGILEVIGGTDLAAGTMLNAVSVYPTVRVGLMNPYFAGIFHQFLSNAKERVRRNFQFYFIVRPKVSFIISNALVQGQVVTRPDETPDPKNSADISNCVAALDYGIVISYGHFGLSYTQKPTTEYRKGLYSHNVGNISLYFGH